MERQRSARHAGINCTNGCGARPDPNRYDLMNRSGQRRPVRHLAVHRLRGAKQMRNQPQTGLPARQGLYDPRFEHDACGVSFVANIKGVASRSIVAMGIGALCNMEHRGATGAEADTGDGAGILIQVPDRFLREPSSTSSCRRRARTRSAWRSCPLEATDAEKAQEVDRDDRRRRGSDGARLARRAGEPRLPRRQRPGRDADLQAAVRLRPGWREPASTSTARCSSPASASSTSCPPSSRPTSRRSAAAR